MSGNTRFAVSVHILAYLACRQGAAVSSAEIATSVATHAVVIRRLLSALVKARLVTARKGAKGGFLLASAPANISLLAVYRAVEPDPHGALKHLAPNHRCPVGARIGNVLQDIFFRAQAAMEAQLERMTISNVEQQLRVSAPISAKSHAL